MEKLLSSKWRSIWLIAFSLMALLSRAYEMTLIRERVQHRGRPLQNSLRLEQTGNVVVMDNGIVKLVLSNPAGHIIDVKYKGISNCLEIRNTDTNRGYWDMMWGLRREGKNANNYNRISGTKFHIIHEDENHIEVSFTKTWRSNSSRLVPPFNVDKRYIMLRDFPGYYSYGIIEHPKEAPAAQIGAIRLVHKLQQDKFDYMAISDVAQRIMASPKDRKHGKRLDYPEAVLLTNPSNHKFKGEVDDKYQYSREHRELKVHGWISPKPRVGFWVITPSAEYLTAGPTKQELTSHVGPTAISTFMSTHYVGRELIIRFKEGEYWKKVFGPVPFYLNSASTQGDYHRFLWEDAKRQAEVEVSKWPYDFVQPGHVPFANQRGSVNGRLLVRDRYVNQNPFEAKFAYVGLAAPGVPGSWQLENKGYQFWIQADKRGNFLINNVRPGNYSLYAFVPGVLGEFMHTHIITIAPGSKIQLGGLIFYPPRIGPTLWEIGIPDRAAAEFYIPDPLPSLSNKLYINKPFDKFRQYGLWGRYTDLYPKNDLVYTINVSDYRRDWFFAQVNRNLGNKTYKSTTWQVKFNIEHVIWRKTYTLHLALASITNTDLKVRFNDKDTIIPLFSTHLIGQDNSIARHGIHGLYRLYSVNVPSDRLRRGVNILHLTQSRTIGPFGGIMYDYIRFESP